MRFGKQILTLGMALGLLAAGMPASHAAAPTPVKGGTVVYLSSKIPSLNPLHSAYEVGLVTSQIFASLTRMDENNEVAPYIAESWDISADGKTYTFKIAENAKFHDGKPVTGEDLAFSFDIVKEHHRFGPQMFGPIERYEHPDPKTLVVHLSQPHGPLLLAATTPRQMPVMPKHVYGDADDFMKHPAHKEPIGSGPFKISDRKTDEYVSIVRNEDHFVEGCPISTRSSTRTSRTRRPRESDCGATSSSSPAPTPSCASVTSRRFPR